MYNVKISYIYMFIEKLCLKNYISNSILIDKIEIIMIKLIRSLYFSMTAIYRENSTFYININIFYSIK